MRPTAKLFAFLSSCVISNTFATGFFTRCFFHLAVQFSRYRMKCVSRLRFLLPLRSLLSFAFAPAFRPVPLSLPVPPLLSASFLSAFRSPSLSSALASASLGLLRFASSFPLRFRAALRFPLLRFPALPSAFASGFARSALPFGFRLRSSLRFFLAFARLPRAQLFRFLPFRVFRFPLPSFAFAPAFRVRSAPLPASPSALLSLRFPVRFPLPCCFLHSFQFSVLPDP